MCLFEVGNTILAYRISRACRYKSLDRIIIKRARITILLQISPLHRKRSFFLRIDTSSMQPITNTEFVIKKKRRTGSECLPLVFQRSRWLMFYPSLKIRGRQMLEIMSTSSKFTCVATAIKQIKHMITSIMEECNQALW